MARRQAPARPGAPAPRAEHLLISAAPPARTYLVAVAGWFKTFIFSKLIPVSHFLGPKDANNKTGHFPARRNKYERERVMRFIDSLGFVSFRASSTAFAPCLRCSSRSGRSSDRRTPPNPEASPARWPAVAVAARRPPRPQAPLQRRLSSYRSSTQQPRAAEAGFGLGFGLLGLGRERVRVRVRTRFRVRLSGL